MESTGNSSSIPSKTLILIALLQGFALLLLHQAIEFRHWPHNEPHWLFGFYSVAVATPVMLLLGLSEHSKPVYKWAGIFTTVIFGLGYYVGHQAIPLEHIRFETLLFLFVATLCVATFKALMYVQHFAAGGPLTYSRLFLLSWRNFLTLGLSLLFMLCTWGVLMLWAGLFKAIKINFFYDLFTEKWFYYPVLALAHGFGVIIFRFQSGVIDTITRIQQAMMKFLLVILSLVSVIFLFALPFAGLAPLWETGGSSLILWMQALMLFSINAVYQDEPESQPYHLWVHRFICIGVALLPIYSAISFYGLSLRVEQYGWSVSRCWALLLWSVFAAFSIGYLWGILKLKDHWLRQLSWINVRMGLVVLGLMLLVNSPLLDFRKISVNSQIDRLKQGVVSRENFDFRYLRNELARPGYEALQVLREEVKAEHPEIALRIQSYYADKDDKRSTSKSDFVKAITGLTEDTPEDLIDAIYVEVTKRIWQMQQTQSYELLVLDLNNDGDLEYVFAQVRQREIELAMYHNIDGRWESRVLRSIYGQSTTSKESNARLLEALEKREYGAAANEWQFLQIGEHLFQVL
ncbi:MAG: DUF4153 domain-containing protein [Cellvibrionaceae bacterium]